MAESKTILVEVAYAKPDKQVIIPLQVKPGTQLVEAIKLSGILEQFPEIDLEKSKLGIFSKVSKPDTVLREKDRAASVLIKKPKQKKMTEQTSSYFNSLAASSESSILTSTSFSKYSTSCLRTVGWYGFFRVCT
jgi:putative ubiquitin-RnfH superfamily antitoxin RatB of RatAB toxin-antitoxin module